MNQIKFFIIIISFSFINAQQERETIILGDYNSIYVYQGIEVDLIKSDINKISLESSNVDPLVFGYKIKNGILKLRQTLDKNLSIGKVKVTIYNKSSIETIKLFQGSTMKIKNPLIQTNVEIKVQEGSSLNGCIKVDKILVEVFSGGSADLKGETTICEIISSTGGIFSGEELFSKQLKVKSSFGSLAYVRSSVLMEANASIGSTVRVYGQPKKIIQKTSFGGKIIRMKETSPF